MVFGYFLSTWTLYIFSSKKSLKVRYPHKIAQTAILGFLRFLISGRRFITASSALSEITQWWGRVNGDPKDIWRSSKRWLDYGKLCRGLCQKKCEYGTTSFLWGGGFGMVRCGDKSLIMHKLRSKMNRTSYRSLYDLECYICVVLSENSNAKIEFFSVSNFKIYLNIKARVLTHAPTSQHDLWVWGLNTIYTTTTHSLSR